MTPISIVGFVTRSGGDSNAPGSSVQQVNIAGQRGPNPAAKGPNDSLFAAPPAGNITLTMQGVTPAVAAALLGGQAVLITISDLPVTS